MKILRKLTATLLATVVLTAPIAGFAAEKKAGKNAPKPKPYTLNTCAVSDEKLGGDMGEPYVFTHEGREIKLCCKSCLKDFKKAPAKFIKKIEEAEKKAKK
ncbi:MAG: TRASH domain-containing protein [Verrucomicrobiota bacterium]